MNRDIPEQISEKLEDGRFIRLPDGTIDVQGPKPLHSGPSGGKDRSRRLNTDGSPNPRYRRRIYKSDRGEFIAVDGEGYNRRDHVEPFETRLPPAGRWTAPYDAIKEQYRWHDGRPSSAGHDYRGTVRVTEQDYVMLATSTGGYLYNPDGLGTEACLNLLIQEGLAHPQAIFCGFGLSYDIEMMLKDLPRQKLEKLHKGEDIAWKGYGLRYHRGKLLWVQDGDASRTRTFRMPSTTLYDVHSFFSKSFLGTVEKWFPECPDLELLQKGKALRSGFAELDDEAWIRLYNDAENRALVTIMQRFWAALKEGGVLPRKWYGPGAIAAELLRQHQVREHLARTYVNVRGPSGQEIRKELEAVPEHTRDAALHAFAGGRIEAIKVGNHDGVVWKYDINSAYPATMPDLPTLRRGTWTLHDRKPKPQQIVPYGLYEVRWSFPDDLPFYPFFWRTRAGGILFPPAGVNWVWGVELLAALECGARQAVDLKITRWISFEPAEETYPLTWVQDLSAHRLELKKAGNPAEVGFKLGLNSLYGKFAQQRGFKEENGKVVQIPPYYQPEYGGFITAATRATIYRAAMQRPQAIVGFMTDGVFSLERLDLELGEGLGQWDEIRLDWLTQVQSGIYWFQTTDEDGVPSTVQHHRGFDPPRDDDGPEARPLTRERVLAAYQHGDPVLECRMRRLVTLGQALAAFRGRQPDPEEFEEDAYRPPDLWPQLRAYVLGRGGLARGDFSREAIPGGLYRIQGVAPDVLAAEMIHECAEASGLWNPTEGTEAMLEALQTAYEFHRAQKDLHVPRDLDRGFHTYWRRWRHAPRFLNLAMQTGKRSPVSEPRNLRAAAVHLVETRPRLTHPDQAFSEPARVLWSDWRAMLADLEGVDAWYDGTRMSAIEEGLPLE